MLTLVNLNEPSAEEEPSVSIHSIFHVNLNCRNLDVSLPFYQALGFTVEMAFPEAGHPAVSEGLGVGPHRVKGALLRLGDDPHAARLDLLEWLSPRNEQPSPLTLSDPGIVRIALASSDFEADVKRLEEMGVTFISRTIYRETPTGRQPMFVCFRDPDGNVLELVNRPRPAA
jgi:catechol 2,3-dioxygenase-like lactoylglutathione lyase family enzyme